MYTYLSIFGTFVNFFLWYNVLFVKKNECTGHGKDGRIHSSWSQRDQRTLERVAGARLFFIPARVNKTTSLVSVREAFFCTYVNVECRLLCALS